MKRIPKRPTAALVLLILLAGAVPATAAETALVLLSKVTETGVRLKWVPTDKRTDCTYTLTRTEAVPPGASGKQAAPVVLGTFRMKTLAELSASLPPETVKELTPLLFPQSLYKTDFEKLRILAEEENRKGMLFFLAETRKELMEILGIAFEDRTAATAKTYLYTVEARLNGAVIASAQHWVKTGRPTPMNVPQATAVRYAWGAALKWTNFDTYAAFHIYRSTREKGPYVRITQTPVGVNYQVNEARQTVTPPYFHSDTGLDETKIYYYRVTGVDSFGDESPQSPPAFAIRDAARRPAPLRAVTTTPGDREVTLGWAANEKGLRFNLFRGYRANGTFHKLNDAPLDGTTFTDTALAYGQDYFYSVTGVRGDGTESLMSPPTHFPCRDLVAPAPPTGIRGVSKAGQVILEWDAVAAPDLAGVHVYRAYAADEPDWTRLTDAPLASQIFVDTLSKALDKQSFYYKLCASDTRGNTSGWSETLVIKLPDVTAPLAPVWSDWSQERGAVTLTWLPSKAPDLAGYLLYRGKGNRKTLLTPLPLAATRFTDPKAPQGETLTYALVAVDSAGNRSPESSPREIRTLDTTPPSITAFSVTSEKGRVRIEATVAAADVKAMTIQRARKSEGGFETIRSMHPATTYIDKRVNPGTTYAYRVILYDRAGNATTSPTRETMARQ